MNFKIRNFSIAILTFASCALVFLTFSKKSFLNEFKYYLALIPESIYYSSGQLSNLLRLDNSFSGSYDLNCNGENNLFTSSPTKNLGVEVLDPQGSWSSIKNNNINLGSTYRLEFDNRNFKLNCKNGHYKFSIVFTNFKNESFFKINSGFIGIPVLEILSDSAELELYGIVNLKNGKENLMIIAGNKLRIQINSKSDQKVNLKILDGSACFVHKPGPDGKNYFRFLSKNPLYGAKSYFLNNEKTWALLNFENM